MKILQLFVKEKSSDRAQAQSQIQLLRGYGIAGDRHAQFGSPRQVLIVDAASPKRFGLEPGDLSENILVDTSIGDWQSGQIWQIGNSALIRLTFPCEPCFKLDQLQPGLAKAIGTARGFLALVVYSGTIQISDRLVLTPHQLPALSAIAKERFQEFVARIPAGKVVRTSDLLIALGCSKGYYRAIPAFLKKAASNLPTHRLVAADGSLLTQYMPDQADQLAREGIGFIADRPDPNYYWEPAYFHALDP